MYHPRIIEQACERYEAAHRIKLKRYTIPEIEERLASLPSADSKGILSRPLNREEKVFVNNEQTLTSLDFLYWAERYGKFISDPEAGEGGLRRFVPWESQRLSLEVTAKIQLEQWDKKKRGETVEGIRRVDHKGRQMGLTQLDCFMVDHRMTRCSFQRCVAASVDDDKVQELYDRHKTIYDHLPFYLKPAKKYDNKAQDWQLKETGAVILYQNATQRGGLAQGRARDVAQFTEMASWDQVAGWDITRTQFELQFLPTLPRALGTLALIESTSLYRGDWWHDFVDRVRKGQMPGWVLNFIPYYAEKTRYRRTPPFGWKPSTEAIKHAKMVWETSPEFMGKNVMLDKEQLYWWETQSQAAKDGRALNLFLTNYCCTPDQSFQHATQGAFEPEMLESLRQNCHKPGMYAGELEHCA